MGIDYNIVLEISLWSGWVLITILCKISLYGLDGVLITILFKGTVKEK